MKNLNCFFDRLCDWSQKFSCHSYSSQLYIFLFMKWRKSVFISTLVDQVFLLLFLGSISSSFWFCHYINTIPPFFLPKYSEIFLWISSYRFWIFFVPWNVGNLNDIIFLVLHFCLIITGYLRITDCSYVLLCTADFKASIT